MHDGHVVPGAGHTFAVQSLGCLAPALPGDKILGGSHKLGVMHSSSVVEVLKQRGLDSSVYPLPRSCIPFNFVNSSCVLVFST